MAGIQARGQALRSFHTIEDRGEMFRLAPQATPLPRGIFERNPNMRTLSGSEHLVQAGNDLLESFGLATTQMSAWMHDEERQLQRCSKLDFLDQ